MIINSYTMKSHIIPWPQPSFVLEVSLVTYFFISNYISKIKRYNGVWKMDATLLPKPAPQICIHCPCNPFLHHSYLSSSYFLVFLLSSLSCHLLTFLSYLSSYFLVIKKLLQWLKIKQDGCDESDIKTS